MSDSERYKCLQIEQLRYCSYCARSEVDPVIKDSSAELLNLKLVGDDLICDDCEKEEVENAS